MISEANCITFVASKLVRWFKAFWELHEGLVSLCRFIVLSLYRLIALSRPGTLRAACCHTWRHGRRRGRSRRPSLPWPASGTASNIIFHYIFFGTLSQKHNVCHSPLQHAASAKVETMVLKISWYNKGNFGGLAHTVMRRSVSWF